MTSIRFTKMQGTGNDFIFVDDRDCSIHLGPQEVARLCDRHFGIGADGIMLMRPPHDRSNDLSWWYVNSDGSMPQMCGNGSRCAAIFALENGLVPQDAREIRLETLAGVRTLTINRDAAGVPVSVTVDMGAPITAAQDVPTTIGNGEGANVRAPFTLAELGLSTKVTTVSMGNPHAVILTDDMDIRLDDKSFNHLGPLIENDDRFPEKTNVEFISVRTPHDIDMRVWERGVGETLACGTGACASAVAAHLAGLTQEQVTVHLKGGELTVDVSGDTVRMTGPASSVFSGLVDATMEKGA